ncbi:hypothetical protein K7432_010815, partial [Basidiobolus ranarum]
MILPISSLRVPALVLALAINRAQYIATAPVIENASALDTMLSFESTQQIEANKKCLNSDVGGAAYWIPVTDGTYFYQCLQGGQPASLFCCPSGSYVPYNAGVTNVASCAGNIIDADNVIKARPASCNTNSVSGKTKSVSGGSCPTEVSASETTAASYACNQGSFTSYCVSADSPYQLLCEAFNNWPQTNP